jgi:hypothetical protein
VCLFEMPPAPLGRVDDSVLPRPAQEKTEGTRTTTTMMMAQDGVLNMIRFVGGERENVLKCGRCSASDGEGEREGEREEEGGGGCMEEDEYRAGEEGVHHVPAAHVGHKVRAAGHLGAGGDGARGLDGGGEAANIALHSHTGRYRRTIGQDELTRA